MSVHNVVQELDAQRLDHGHWLVTVLIRPQSWKSGDAVMATSAMGSWLGNTLNARPESESGTESQHVVVYVRRRQRSGDKGRALSV
ncbi:MAG TPA: hypothetical protein VMV72_18440, partial [Verrucomicrobiae bacterium]|nr:hypothetical protein [Verrucomicrobiae bacterium]